MSRSLNYRKYSLLVGQAVAMALAVGGAARCSSSSGNVVTPPESSGTNGSGAGSSGASSSGDVSASGSSTSGSSTSGSSTSGSSTSGSSTSGVVGGGGGTDAGLTIDATADGGCPSQALQTTATKISFSVGWPSSTAGTAGSGTINIWLLSTFTGDSMLTGTAQSCGLTLPDLTLSSLGMTATGGGTKIQIQITNSTWDKITRTFKVTGTQNGWNVGNTQSTDPSLALLGLTDNSGFGTDTTAWPPICATGKCASTPPATCMGGTCSGTYAGSFAGNQVTDDDGDGKPGITANPANGNGYVLPPTAAFFAASASEVYIVSRNEIAISSMRATDCTHLTGTATVTGFDNHVVGCYQPKYTDGLGTMHDAAVCNSDEVGFLDSNRTIYGYDQTSGDVITKAHPVMGTVKGVLLNAGAKCSDARGALP